jgi:NRPS condensation-like uncharacterized protein
VVNSDSLFANCKAPHQNTTKLRKMLKAPVSIARESTALFRPLGAAEQLMWLLDQNRSRHFVLAAQVEGHTTIEGWRAALDLVQQRHPLLSVLIETSENSSPHFRQVTGAAIPLRVVEGKDAVERWESEIEQELFLPFNFRQAPLVRAVLLHEAHRVVYILSVHHSVADGVSLAFVIRDTLEALIGKPIGMLPAIPTSEEILGITGTTVNPVPNSKPPGRPAIYRKKDGSIPRVKGLRLTPELTIRLRERARQEGTTVHGALCAALALAYKESSGESSQDLVRIWSPVDIRNLLGLGADCALLASPGVIFIEPQSLAAFWAIARGATASLTRSRTLEAVFSSMSFLRGALAKGMDVQAAATIMAHNFGFEICLSNLGNLRYETHFGELRLAALWGPAVLSGFEGEQEFGVATANGALCLLHTSYTPAQSLLDLTEQILVSACGPGQ